MNAHVTPARKRLAIVSSYNESCGNASYTHVLKLAFGQYVDVDVLPLDGFVLQKSARKFRVLGDRFIDDLAEKLKRYDYVNFQFEAGLYGASQKDVMRRITKLLDAAPNFILTMHRFDAAGRTPWHSYLSAALSWSIKPILQDRSSRTWERFYSRLAAYVATLARRKNAWIAVHTRRERRIVRELAGCPNVFDHPITFLAPEERRALIRSDARDAFRVRHGAPEGVKIIGAFGFVSAYKSHETLVRALRLLPSNYHLYIFGSQHPSSIRQNVRLEPYLDELIELVRDETSDYVKDRSKRLRALRGGALVEQEARGLLDFDLMQRVKFVGELDDPEFLQALRFCDAVVLPYMEVGQSMSGVIALAIECGGNLFCANNLSFGEVRKYYGDVYTRFDIGNYVELAQKLQDPPVDYRAQREAAYGRFNLHNNVMLHLKHFGLQIEPVAAEAPMAAKMPADA